MSIFEGIKRLFGGKSGTDIPDGARVFNVNGMMCAHCEEHTQKAVCGIAGVRYAKADHEKGRVYVVADDNVSDDDIRRAITDAGYVVA